jgi:hypothetical protein
MVHTTLLGDRAGNAKGWKPFIRHFLQRQLEDQMYSSLGNSTHTYIPPQGSQWQLEESAEVSPKSSFLQEHYSRSCPSSDRLCGVAVRVPGYRFRDPGFDSRRYQVFWEVVSLERGPLSLLRETEELLEWKSSGSGSRKPRLTALGIRCADNATPSIRKSWH